MATKSDQVVEPKPEVIKETKVKDGAKVKAYLQAKGHMKTKLDKQKWGTSDEIIESAVKLHGSNLENYRNSGLG